MQNSLKHYIKFFSALISFICVFCSPLRPQTKKIDSLLKVIKTAKEDSFKVIALNSLARKLEIAGEFDTSLFFAGEAMNLALKINYKKGLANAFSSMGNSYYNKGNYTEALKNHFAALKIDSAIKNISGMAARYGNIGLVYYQQGNYLKAVDNYFNALKIAEKLGDENRKSIQLGNIGLAYTEEGEYAKALGYYVQALKIAEKLGNKENEAIWVHNMAIIYRAQNNYSESMEYYKKALVIAEEIGDLRIQASALGGIGASYGEQMDEKSIGFYLKAIKISEEIGAADLAAVWYGNLGNCYVSFKKFDAAFKNLYRALALSDSIGALNEVKNNYESLSSLYEKSGIALPDSTGGKLLNMEQMRLRALYYHKRYISIRDTLFSEENKKQLVRKEMNFEFEKKEAETKADQDKKNAIQEAESKKQKIIMFSVVGCLLLVICFAGFIFRALRITRKQKLIIEHQKHIVDEKQKEILDSIYYARRIQTALITNEKYISKNLHRLSKIKR